MAISSTSTVTARGRPNLELEEILLDQPSSADHFGRSPSPLPTHRAGYTRTISPTEASPKAISSPKSAYVPQSPLSAQPYSTAYSGMFATTEMSHQDDESDKSLAQTIYSAAGSGVFTASQWFKGSSEPQKHLKLRRTAYLDGLRGFGALLVYILHNECWAHSANMEMVRIPT